MIDRPQYMAWLDRWREKDVIKVLTGMRRCGKSTILSLYQVELHNSGIMPFRQSTSNGSTRLTHARRKRSTTTSSPGLSRE